MTRKRWKDPDKRMYRAAELRQQGWSLRRIAEELAVGVATIHRDLARYGLQELPFPDRPQLRVVPSAFHGGVPLDPNGTKEWNGNGTREEAG